jgi:hypothetical protein
MSTSAMRRGTCMARLRGLQKTCVISTSLRVSPRIRDCLIPFSLRTVSISTCTEGIYRVCLEWFLFSVVSGGEVFTFSSVSPWRTRRIYPCQSGTRRGLPSYLWFWIACYDTEERYCVCSIGKKSWCSWKGWCVSRWRRCGIEDRRQSLWIAIPCPKGDPGLLGGYNFYKDATILKRALMLRARYKLWTLKL